jgi:hypothetical protein
VEAASVYAIPDDVEPARRRARHRGSAAGGAESEILTSSRREGIRVDRAADRARLARKVVALRLPGIHSVPESKRFYPKGSLAGAVLGFVGTDDSGLAGLEHLYDKQIRGKPGEIVALTDARRSRYGEAETAAVRRERRVARPLARLGRPVRRRARARRRDGTAPREVGQRRRDGSLERRDPRDGVGARLRPERVPAYPAEAGATA